MRNLVLIFLRFGHFILFILLEIFCLYLIVNYNRRQRDIWANSSNIAMGYASEKWNDWTNYFSLSDKMDVLAIENALLKDRLINYELKTTPTRDSSILDQEYELISAQVINNSIDKPNNSITLNKGSKHGIKKGMGVISNNGIVGIVRSVNEKYAAVISLLHRRSSISASIKRSGAYGGLKWQSTNPRYVNLTAIANHHKVEVGDTIITSGYSAHFPPGIMIGTVEKTSLPSGSNFHEIEVLLGNDFSALNYVEVIKNLNQDQRLELEKEVSDE